MTSYNGFSKTAYGSQGGDDSGGFIAGGSQPGGSQGGDGRKNYQDESLRPVTIKQIIEAEEPYPGADSRIDGVNVTQVTFVAQVRSINHLPTNITYRLDDGTGIVDVKQWIDAHKRDDDLMDGGADGAPGPAGGSPIEVDQYVRVWGRLRPYGNRRHVVAHFIRPVSDFNEVNYHLLEATYVHLYVTRGPPGGGPGGKQENGAGGDGMFVDGGAGYTGGAGAGAGAGASAGKLSGCGPLARKMCDFLNNAPGGNEGVHLNLIASSTGMTVNDVLRAADELLSQGLIYTTIDDETWAILEY